MTAAGKEDYAQFQNYIRDQILSAADYDAVKGIGKYSKELTKKFVDTMHGYLLSGIGYGHQIAYERAVKQGADFATRKYEPLPPEEAINHFAQIIPVPESTWLAMSTAARSQALKVAGVESEFWIGEIKARLDTALQDGTGFKEFKDGIEELFKSDWHAETVFRTNLETAYEAGRYNMVRDPSMRKYYPAYQYKTVGDDAVRPEHAALEGLIYRADDPFWDTYWPPNDYNCRCTVVAIFVDDFDESDLSDSAKKLELPAPAEGFDHNPAQAFE